MATHSGILVKKIPLTENLVGYSLWGCKELDTTEQLNTHTHTKTLRHRPLLLKNLAGFSGSSHWGCGCPWVCSSAPCPFLFSEILQSLSEASRIQPKLSPQSFETFSPSHRDPRSWVGVGWTAQRHAEVVAESESNSCSFSHWFNQCC